MKLPRILSFFQRRQNQNRRRNTRTMPLPGTRILVVDDSQTVRTVIKRMLLQAGFVVLEAGGGAVAIEMARKHRPALIFMDIVMPGMNGFVATRKLSKLPETRLTPVVIMSGDKDASEKYWVEGLGASAFIPKPFTRADVFMRVEEILFKNEIR